MISNFSGPDQAQELTYVDIDTFLSCFMLLTRLDLLQGRADVFPLYRHPLR
jgi:hypothetical protein